MGGDNGGECLQNNEDLRQKRLLGYHTSVLRNKKSCGPRNILKQKNWRREKERGGSKKIGGKGVGEAYQRD